MVLLAIDLLDRDSQDYGLHEIVVLETMVPWDYVLKDNSSHETMFRRGHGSKDHGPVETMVF